MIFRTKADNQIALSPCSESETRRNWGSVRKIWNTVISNRGGNPTVPIGSLILWTRTLAEKPDCYVLADGIQNSIENGGSGIDYTGVFIKLDSVDPGTAVAASSTSSDSAGTASGTTNSVTLTATISGTTGSTSAGTASGNTAYESAHYHSHHHTIASGLVAMSLPTDWEGAIASGSVGNHQHGSGSFSTISLSGHDVAVTSVADDEVAFRAAAEGTGPSHGIQTNTDQTTSSHRHAFSGVTFGAHTHSFSGSDAGVGTSGEDNHNHTFSSTLSGHSHTSGSPAATTIIPLEYIGC